MQSKNGKYDEMEKHVSPGAIKAGKGELSYFKGRGKTTSQGNTTRQKSQLRIKVKYLRNVDPIEKIDIGDWLDLRCAEDTLIKKGEYKQIPLGVAMELPDGYEAIIAPRSSTFRKYGVLLTNGIGIIDNSYCGPNDEWNFLAYATEETFIPKNERICQFRILRNQPRVNIVTVKELNNPNRNGIGSTGRT